MTDNVRPLHPTDGRPSLTTADKEALIKTQYCSRHFEGASGVPQTCPTCVREDIIKRLGSYGDPAKSSTLHLAATDAEWHSKTMCGATLTKWVSPLPTTDRTRVECPDCLIVGYIQRYVEAPEDPKVTSKFTEPPLVTSPYKEVPVDWSRKPIAEVVAEAERRREARNHQSPHWEHDCDSCEYLGSRSHCDREYDLYYCPPSKFSKGKPNLIARHGLLGDYVSGLDWIDREPILALAFVLALRQGRIVTADIR